MEFVNYQLLKDVTIFHLLSFSFQNKRKSYLTVPKKLSKNNKKNLKKSENVPYLSDVYYVCLGI
jgi:hypothetical protein